MNRHTNRMRRLALLAGLLPLAAAAQGWQAPPKPSPGLMPNPVLGKPLYQANCAQCHGVALKGSEQGPPLVHRIYEPSHHGDAAFQLAVAHGARAHHWQFGDMAPVPGLSPDEVAHITAHVRVAQRKAGIR